MSSPSNTVFVFNSYGMGHTENADLKIKLVKKALTLLGLTDPLPAQLCFYTDGVKLCVRGSPVLNELRALADQGVQLVLCSTCLEAFGLQDEVAIGIVSGMDHMITAMLNADRVVTL
ncbi:MAG: DsrE family protein [Acidobacteriota bacterium]